MKWNIKNFLINLYFFNDHCLFLSNVYCAKNWGLDLHIKGIAYFYVCLFFHPPPPFEGCQRPVDCALEMSKSPMYFLSISPVLPSIVPVIPPLIHLYFPMLTNFYPVWLILTNFEIFWLLLITQSMSVFRGFWPPFPPSSCKITLWLTPLPHLVMKNHFLHYPAPFPSFPCHEK